jgi:hypothetical protein
MRLRWRIAGLVFAAAFVGGWLVAGGLPREPLRREVEARLAKALGGPVAIGSFQVRIGLGLHLQAQEVTAWPSADGPRLTVDRVAARLRPFAFLIGGPTFGSVRLDGLRLALARDREGAISPPPLARLAPSPSAPAPAAEPWLAPVAALEALTHALLDGPRLADRIELHGAQVVFDDARVPGRARSSLALDGLEARLRRFRVLGGAELFLRARLLAGGAERGTLEMLGSRARGGGVELALAATSLDLATLAPYLPRREPAAPLAGTLSGYVGYRGPAPGEAVLELDLLAADLRTVVPAFGDAEPRPLALERVDLAGFLEVSPGSVRLREMRLENGSLSLEAGGRLARPLGANSAADLALALHELDVHELRDALAWLPEVRREQAARALTRIEAGRLARLEVRGAAPLRGWQAFLSGRTRLLPERFSLEADVADARLRVGDRDHLSELSGRLAWTGDRVEVKGARARLDDTALPVLDLVLDGVSNFLAGDPERRRLAPGGRPLRGFGALADVLAGDPDERDEPEAPLQTRIRLEVDAIDHPVLLWPIERLAADIALAPDGVHVEALHGSWAGVPVAGAASFTQRPEPAARVSLVASPPLPATPVATGPGWGRGRFEVERLASRVWSHEHASGRFTALEARLDLADVVATLAPSGRIEGNASLDLGRHGTVPYRASFVVKDGDVPALAAQLGLDPEAATGRIDLAGSFEGSLTPGAPASQGLSGLLSGRARDGEIRRALPAVMAIALASRSLNPFSGREQIRYEHASSVLEFSDGDMHTESFTLDGPDLRVFASGDVALASPEHEVDAHVVLFLFRQLDGVIDKIPVLNLLLLGTNQNLLAAYFDLTGPWADPQATLVPLRSLATGPASLVLEGVPFLVRKSLEAIGAIDVQTGVPPARPFAPEPPPPKES